MFTHQFNLFSAFVVPSGDMFFFNKVIWRLDIKYESCELPVSAEPYADYSRDV